MSIDYLLIGNVTRDVTPDGLILGGTALYSAVTARRLGLRVGLISRLPETLVTEVERALEGVEIFLLPAERVTTFENRYEGDRRTQYLHDVSPPIDLDALPEAWATAPIVHLGALTAEVPPSAAARFAGSLVGATPQGWLRAWDERGLVSYRPMEDPSTTLAGIEVLVFSAEDVAHEPAAIEALIRAVPLAVITEAASGATIYTDYGRDVRPMPARPARVVDPTGAGDVFAAAFLARYHAERDPYEAAAFANAVASFSIEARGIAGIPWGERVERWLREQTPEERR